MRLTPTYRFTPRSVGLLHPSEQAPELESEYESVKPDIVFVPRPVATSYLKRGQGVAYMRNSTLTRWEWEPGHSAYALPANASDATLADLCHARDWTEAHGATFCSVQGTAMSLLRASLDRTLELPNGGPHLSRVAGGRIHSVDTPRMVPFVESWDIHAAFAETLSLFRPCGYWRHGAKLIDDGDQFVRCTVHVPYMAQWGPLPVPIQWVKPHYPPSFPRIHYPQDVTLSGVWTGYELRSALAHGATIEHIESSWTLRHEDRQPFAQWWEWIREGRQEPGPAGAFLKAVSQSLWGVFAVSSNSGTRLHYVKDKPRFEPVPDSRIIEWRRNLPLADTLSARVRVRVFEDFIVPRSPDILGVLTDGGLVTPGDPPTGYGWRLKDRGADCRFFSEAEYEYLSESGSLVRRAFGWPEPDAEQHLRTLIESRFGSTRFPPLSGTPEQKLRLAFPTSIVYHERYGHLP